ncbi:hypothetical protein [Jutongia sp.]
MSKRGTTEAEKLLDAIGQLPEDMLEQALETAENETETRAYRRQRRHRREIIGGLAAAAVLCVVVLGKHDRDFVRQQQSVEKSGILQSDSGSAADQPQKTKDAAIEVWALTEYAGAKSSESGESKSGAGDTQKQAFNDDADMLLENGANKDGGTDGDENAALKGTKIEATKRIGLRVTKTGSGKKKKVEFALQFGEKDGQGEYRLTASGVTLHMVEGQTKKPKFVRKENKTTVVTCPSGTQLRCVMKPSAKAEITITRTDEEGSKISGGTLTIERTDRKYEAVLK